MSSPSAVFIGCACDRSCVEPTAVMLSSVDANAALHDAIVLVAGFDLDRQDRAMLLAGAGRLGRRLRFVDLAADSLPQRLSDRFKADDPISPLGRLFLPAQIGMRHARLITLDSDMIVDAELRPLIELDLGGRVCAAVHDLSRRDDPSAFDSGLMVIDVDEYNANDMAVRCLRWLSSQDTRRGRPDQDALNAVIGADWLGLETTWNSFYEDHTSTAAGHGRGAVTRFAAHPKPWNDTGHAGASLYTHHRASLQERLERRASDHGASGREFLATCYEVLLGRELEHGPVIRERETWPATRIVRSIVESSEFQANILTPLQQGRSFQDRLFHGVPTMRQRFWAADQLPVSGTTVAQLLSAPGWSDFLTILLADTAFAEAMALSYLPLPGQAHDDARRRPASAG